MNKEKQGIEDLGERMSEEGSVLLKNNGALPLTADETKKVSLLGFSSYYPVRGGIMGSSFIAQTFNKALAEEYGKVCGNYSLWSNLTIYWGCGTNLHRSPYNARNHEYYSQHT